MSREEGPPSASHGADQCSSTTNKQSRANKGSFYGLRRTDELFSANANSYVDTKLSTCDDNESDDEQWYTFDSATPSPTDSPTNFASSASLTASPFSIITNEDLPNERSPSPSEQISSSFSKPTPSPSEESSSRDPIRPMPTSMWRWRSTTQSDDGSPLFDSHSDLADRSSDRLSNVPKLFSADLTSIPHDTPNNPADLSSSISAAFARLSIEDADNASDAQAASIARPTHQRETVPRPYLTTTSINAINEWLRSLERSPPLAPFENPLVSPEYPPAPFVYSPTSSDLLPAPSAYPPASFERPSGASSLLWQAAPSDPLQQAAPFDPPRHATPSELSRIDVSRRRLAALRRAAPWREAPLDT